MALLRLVVPAAGLLASCCSTAAAQSPFVPNRASSDSTTSTITKLPSHITVAAEESMHVYLCTTKVIDWYDAGAGLNGHPHKALAV